MDARTLKIIAMVSMTIDHFFMVLKPWLYAKGSDGVLIYELGRAVGRIAFPIYGMLLVEGFIHTRDLKKYLGSMILLSIISEIPFNMATNRGALTYTKHQNVFFSLTLALITMYCIKLVLERFPADDMLRYDLTGLVIALSSLTAYLIKCDYKQGGILMITAMYLFRINMGSISFYNEARACMLLIASTVLLIYSKSESFAYFSVPLCACYNGERGRIKHKYLYYLFYPVHLLAFGFLAMAIKDY